MADLITLTIDGRSTAVAAGSTLAAAIAIAADARNAGGVTRRSVGGQLRAPLCGMGVCQECRVTVDSRAHVLSCQTLCAQGMDVQTGAAA
ncbi:2Fe-2S iron-sulfur cluster-binding protein [Massilia sp. SR12]